MRRVGIIGWRGMVGSVLMSRMREENDFSGFEPHFFSTSQMGQTAPDLGIDLPRVKNARNIGELSQMEIIVTCQGGDYTKEFYPQLRQSGWKGYWIDAASTLRMKDDAIIILDPVNRSVIDSGLQNGTKDYIGGNCTVSLMLMALSGLFKIQAIDWITSMTYQAASGAGAQQMRELIQQMDVIGKATAEIVADPASAILDIDRQVNQLIQNPEFPTTHFGAPLACNVLPWIDSKMDNGQSREEWKGLVETNKILNTPKLIPVDGLCIRVGAMRCHSQALTIKLKKILSLEEITEHITTSNEWVRIIPNEKADSIKFLTPAAVSGTLNIAVGRIRKLNLGPEYLTLFTVGDQLLWGAAEPIRRMLKILLDFLNK